MSKIRRCTRCIMDDSADETITFNEKGECNYCSKAIQEKSTNYYPNEEGQQKLEELIQKVKEKGKNAKYDCLMGLSGGLDSSYLAYLGAAQWGLRIAAVHIDDGYDTETSSRNIAKLCSKAGIELITVQPDPVQFNSLTKAFLKAGVPNLSAPQDNILFASLYSFARKNQLSYFLSGSNFATESITQKGNTHSAYDLVNLKDINRRFGENPIDKLPLTSKIKRRREEFLLQVQTLCPLNLLEYNRDRALQELYDYCGFEYYGRKHLENYLTAFVQLRWFPEKFGVDKRKWHLSSMIISGQMSRDEALAELQEPLYSEAYIKHVNDLMCQNMHISHEELEELVASPSHQHDEYRTDKIVLCYQKVHKHISAFIKKSYN